MTVVDASAMLALLLGEPGADQVEAALGDASISAANWSEVAHKVRQPGGDWDLARSLLISYGLIVEPLTIEDAERAASLWRAGSGLSLGDRCCLALAERLDTSALTTDAAWDGLPQAVLIR